MCRSPSKPKTVKRVLILTAALQCAITFAAPAQTSDWTPPTRVDSPDKRFSIEIRENPEPKHDSGRDERLLTISDRGKQIAEHKTYGYLLDVFWSDTGKYVAVNNRRANAGDYIWIFSLPDGKCVKMADTDQLAFLSRRAGEAIHRLDNRATEDKLEKEWINAKGWWGSGNKLLIRIGTRYGFMIGEFPAHFVYDAVVRIDGSNFVFVSGEARQVAYLGD
jgi:hypothetical protein